MQLLDFSPAAGQAWPDHRGIRVVLEEAPDGDPAKYEVIDRVVVVRLPKAELLSLRISSHPGVGDLPLLGVWQWIVQSGQAPALVDQVTQGRHWMISPHRTLTLVHAVRQPLVSPELGKLIIRRNRGDTFAGLDTDNGAFSAKSTGRLEIVASWNEPVDNGPGTPPPSNRAVEALARVVPLDGSHVASDTRFSLDGGIDRHELGDTKHRDITYTALATTKFADHFVEHEPVMFRAVGTTVALEPHGTEPGIVARSVKITVPATSPDGKPTIYVEGEGFTVNHDDATVTLTRGSPIPTNRVVDVSFTARSITRLSAEPVTRVVPSSERPDAPHVHSVVPTFAWNDPVTLNGVTTSTRSGGSLRVYLERPWNTSGAGEQLAVVLWPVGSALPPNMQTLVSQWGNDPLWETQNRPVQPEPQPAAFPLRVGDRTGLSLEERPGRYVTVAVHDVAFEASRDMWRCDIAINTWADSVRKESYWPFVRLALARFQPDAVTYFDGTNFTDLRLSAVVLMDFVQLAPDRTVTVGPAPGRQSTRKRRVTMTGEMFGSDSGSNKPVNAATVTVEIREGSIGGEFGWTAEALPKEFDEPVVGPEGVATWSTDLTTNLDIVPGRYRLVVEEFELHLTSGDPSNLDPLALDGRRLVHQDIIPLG
jgi:hypothetical protein